MLNRIDIKIWAVFISLLFSVIVINSNPVLNDDAYIYLKAAEVFSNQGLEAAGEVYNWVFYPVLIAIFDAALPGEGLLAAHTLNLLCTSLLIYSFISLCSILKPNKKNQLFAAGLILCFPSINEIRFFIIRDFGFWAFTFYALLQLCKYSKAPNIKLSSLACLSLIVATLFRIEAALFLALLPFIALGLSSGERSQKLKTFFLYLGLLIGLMLVAFFMFKILGISLFNEYFQSYKNYWPQTLNYFNVINESAQQLNQGIFFNDYFPGQNQTLGLLILYTGYLITLAYSLVHVISVPITLTAIYGLLKHYRTLQSSVAQLKPIALLLFTTLIYLLFFLSSNKFLTERYATLSALLVITITPQLLSTMHRTALNKGKLLRFNSFIAFFVFYYLVDSLISFGYSKDYIEESSIWIQENLPSDSTLSTNSRKIAYESHLVDDYHLIDSRKTSYLNQTHSDYLAIVFTQQNIETQEILDSDSNLNFLISFQNSRNDQVRIYQSIQPTQP